MNLLRERSYELEKMDVEGYSFEDLRACLLDIEKINLWTRAHQATLEFVEDVYLQHRKMSKLPMKILDVGFGSGDLLRRLSELADAKGYFFELVGVELHPWACVIAEEINAGVAPIRFENADFQKVEETYDVIVSSLLTHHLSDEDFVRFVQFMGTKARTAWFIHDVHRHPLSYYFVRQAVRWAGLHEMVQYDAPLSVARGFRRREMRGLIDRAEQEEFAIDVLWRFPFKLCVSAHRRGLP